MIDVYPGHDRLTTRVRLALAAAHPAASTLQQAQIEPEHLLLGLLSGPDGLSAAVIHDRGVDPVSVGARVAALAQPPAAPAGAPAVNTAALAVVAEALQIANRWQHHSCGPEHLRMSLVRWPMIGPGGSMPKRIASSQLTLLVESDSAATSFAARWLRAGRQPSTAQHVP